MVSVADGKMAEGGVPAQVDAIVEQVRRAGYARVPAEQVQAVAPSAIREGWAALAASWNDLGLEVYSANTGGCRDALHVDRVNGNQGAESTLAFLLALAEMQALQNSLTTFKEPTGK